MTRFQQDIFNRHLELIDKILKKYLLKHPLPREDNVEDFKQKIYLEILERCCNEDFDSSCLSNGFIKQSVYFSITAVYRRYSLAPYKYDELNKASSIEDMCISLNYEDVFDRIILKNTLKEVMNTLTPREAKVIELRFGLIDGETKTLERVGKEFSLSRDRIRQIEAKALRKLRIPSRGDILRDFY